MVTVNINKKRIDLIITTKAPIKELLIFQHCLDLFFKSGGAEQEGIDPAALKNIQSLSKTIESECIKIISGPLKSTLEPQPKEI